MPSAEYMARYRAEHKAKKLAYDRLYRIAHPEVLNAARRRHAQKARERAKAWYYAHREHVLIRVRLYEDANPDKTRVWKQRWRDKQTTQCPFCGSRMRVDSIGCQNCCQRFGFLCRKNPNCEIKESHKHCPRCSMPILKPKSNKQRLEECDLCKSEAIRGAWMRWDDLGEEEIAA